jgi:hypothetical protein
MTGPNFSSVNLRILSPDGKTVLAELQTIDRAAVRTARNAGDTTSAALSQVQRQAAMSARQIAGNVAQIATVGAATAESMKGILTQGANLAFMFGTGGAIAGAVALTGMAIVSFFRTARSEMEATARKAMEELGRLAESGDAGAIGGRFGIATKLFSGDRFAARREDEGAVAFEVRRRGIQGARQQITEMQAGIADAMARGVSGPALAQLQRSLTTWQTELDKVVRRYEGLLGLMREMEEQIGFAAGRTVAGAKVSFSEGEDRAARDRLDKLLAVPRLSAKAIGFDPKAINPIELRDEMLQTIREGLRDVPPIPATALTPELQEIVRIDNLANSIGMSFGSAVVGGLTAGIVSALTGGGLGGGFEALTGAVLVGLGQMAIRIGTESAAFLSFMQVIQDAIANFMPGLGLAGALGLIGLGSALVAIGGGMGGRSRGGMGGRGGSGSYGYGGGGIPSVIDRGLINPLSGVVTAPGTITPRESIVNHWTIIGENDPRAQRAVYSMWDKANRRRGS